MQPEQIMGSATRLGSSLEALGALAAYLRVETEQLTVDPRVHDLLRRSPWRCSARSPT